MENLNVPLIVSLLIVASLRVSISQTTTTTTTTAATVIQNISSHPHQVMNLHFSVPGSKILGALSWIKNLAHKGDDSFLGRCLGAARKLKFVMPLLIFKLGVIVTTLIFLSIFAMKGLTIGIVLLVLNAVGFLGKAALLKGHLLGHGHKDYGYKDYGISPSLPQPSSPSVHLHVHKDQDGNYDIGPSHPKFHYESYAPTAWSERVHKGLSETQSMSEKMELINLYKRLGFNVNNVLRNEASGGYVVYPTVEDERA